MIISALFSFKEKLSNHNLKANKKLNKKRYNAKQNQQKNITVKTILIARLFSSFCTLKLLAHIFFAHACTFQISTKFSA